MMNSKEKAKRGERRSRAAVNFIVPLQLEECLYHIRHQPRKKTLVRITDKTTADGTTPFVAYLRYDLTGMMRCEGELGRWEGTTTRVIGQLETKPQARDLGCAGAIGELFIVYGLISGVTIIWFALAGLSLTLTALLPIPNSLKIIIWGGSQPLLYFTLLRTLVTFKTRLNQRAVITRLKRILSGTEKY